MTRIVFGGLAHSARSVYICRVYSGYFLVGAVLELTPRDFYKSMESEQLPGLWQDVYHTVYRGLRLYIKIQIGADGRGVVVQYKAR